MQNRKDKLWEPGREEKSNPYKVPENYFESFPHKLQQRLHTERPAELSIPGKAWKVIRPQIALAAVITGFALIGYLGFYNFIKEGDEWLTNEQISEYIDTYEHEFTDYYLLSMLDDDFFLNEEFYFDETPYADDPDAYMDYLYQDDIDLGLILTEY